MFATGEIRFLHLGARRLAYEVRGSGPPLVAPAWWVSHLELDWESPGVRRFWEGVAENYTLIRYDRLGVGMSDRTVRDSDLTLDGEVAMLRALVDELALDRVSLIGGSSGSCTAVAFAARLPERVERLVLYGAYPAAALLRLVYRLDVRALLPLVRQPATVVHRRADRAVPYRLGRAVAAAIPGATLVPLQGASHFPWHGDVDAVVRACRQALAPQQPVPPGVGERAKVALSGREREILACVARGLSDREVAEQLLLSAHTVHRHVANIRRKLGSPSRTAAVAEATRLGLL